MSAAPLITAAGAYEDIPADAYHGQEICPGPSISASGLKTILHKSPRHYWFGSPLNPQREEREDKPHFAFGRAAHDRMLLTDTWRDRYFVMPEGFDARATKKWESAIVERDAAKAAGLTILTFDQMAMVEATAQSLLKHDLAPVLLMSGKPEVTLAWQDPLTGVWLRVRPDWLPDVMRIIPDLKFMADGSPDAFERSVNSMGYHIAAAHYLDGLEAIYGEPAEPRRFVFIVVEKEPPFVVTIYQLDEEDIQRGRMLARKAINIFADCLSRDRWPGYAPLDDDGNELVRHVQLPAFAKARIDAAAERGELSYQ